MWARGNTAWLNSPVASAEKTKQNKKQLKRVVFLNKAFFLQTEEFNTGQSKRGRFPILLLLSVLRF